MNLEEKMKQKLQEQRELYGMESLHAQWLKLGFDTCFDFIFEKYELALETLESLTDEFCSVACRPGAHNPLCGTFKEIVKDLKADDEDSKTERKAG